MAFTYNEALSTDRDRVRFYLQDTTSGSGPRPNGGNLSDAEITGLIAIEGTWQRAVAAGFDVLAAAWANYADLQVGQRREALSQIAARYRQQATDWRTLYGSANTATASVGHITRVDGYSDDYASDEG